MKKFSDDVFMGVMIQGDSYRLKGENKKALEFYKKINAEDSVLMPLALQKMAMIYEERGWPKYANNYRGKAYYLYKNNMFLLPANTPRISYNMGLLYTSCGQHKDARGLFELVEKYNAQDRHFDAVLGGVLKKTLEYLSSMQKDELSKLEPLSLDPKRKTSLTVEIVRRVVNGKDKEGKQQHAPTQNNSTQFLSPSSQYYSQTFIVNNHFYSIPNQQNSGDYVDASKSKWSNNDLVKAEAKKELEEFRKKKPNEQCLRPSTTVVAPPSQQYNPAMFVLPKREDSGKIGRKRKIGEVEGKISMQGGNKVVLGPVFDVERFLRNQQQEEVLAPKKITKPQSLQQSQYQQQPINSKGHEFFSPFDVDTENQKITIPEPQQLGDDEEIEPLLLFGLDDERQEIEITSSSDAQKSNSNNGGISPVSPFNLFSPEDQFLSEDDMFRHIELESSTPLDDSNMEGNDQFFSGEISPLNPFDGDGMTFSLSNNTYGQGDDSNFGFHM